MTRPQRLTRTLTWVGVLSAAAVFASAWFGWLPGVLGGFAVLLLVLSTDERWRLGK